MSRHKLLPKKLHLSSDKAVVYLIKLDIFSTDDFIGLLSFDEKARAKRLRDESKKEQFIITRGILRSILSACLIKTKPQDIVFFYKEHGKPEINNKLADKQIKFNVSHSGTYALLAFTLEHEIGVDIEKINTEIAYNKLSKRFFSHKELIELERKQGQTKLLAFYNGWVRKEAFIKAHGDGISFGLNKFSVDLDESVQQNIINIDNSFGIKNNWFNYAAIELEDYKTAIATNFNKLNILKYIIDN